MSGQVVTLDALAEEVRAWQARGETVGLANGVFELLHVGHVRYLTDAATFVDHLVVAVNSDTSARHHKGPGRPVVPDHERAELLAALRAVERVVIFESIDVVPVIEALRPDVHVKGTDYTPETVPEAEAVKAYGGEVRIAGDPKDHASTELLARAKSVGAVDDESSG